MASQSPETTLAARITASAENLTADTEPPEAVRRPEDIRKLLREEHIEHSVVVGRADSSILAAGRHRRRQATAWHADHEPPIAGLPEDVTVSYQVIPGEVDYWRHMTVRIRLEAEGVESPDEGALAHIGHLDRRMPVTFRIGDQEVRHVSGVVKAPANGGVPYSLTAMDSSSEDFALVSRAVSIVERGELQQEADSRAADRRATMMQFAPDIGPLQF